MCNYFDAIQFFFCRFFSFPLSLPIEFGIVAKRTHFPPSQKRLKHTRKKTERKRRKSNLINIMEVIKMKQQKPHVYLSSCIQCHVCHTRHLSRKKKKIKINEFFMEPKLININSKCRAYFSNRRSKKKYRKYIEICQIVVC